MKSIKEYIILGGIVVLLVLYLVLHKTDRTFYELPKLPELKKADITSLKITKADKTIELQKKEDKWIILPDNYPADTAKVDPLMDAVAGLTVTAMVSESGNYNRYELDDAHKISIQAMTAGKLARGFDIGKTDPSRQHTFVKLLDDKHVYHAQDNLRTKFEVSADALRDLTVLAFDKSQIQQIEVDRKDKEPMVLSLKQAPAEPEAKPEDQSTQAKPEAAPEQPKPPEAEKPEKEGAPKMTWQDAAGTMMKDADVNALLDGMSNLKCKKFIEGKTKADFTNPIYTLKFQGTKPYELLIFEKFKPEDTTYPATSSENEYPFEIMQFKVDDILKKF